MTKKLALARVDGKHYICGIITKENGKPFLDVVFQPPYDSREEAVEAGRKLALENDVEFVEPKITKH